MPTIIVKPQLAGIHKREAFQRSPQATAFDSFNFWPVDAITGRFAPATRPGYAQLSTPTGAVTLIELVSGVRSNFPFNSFAAAFGGSLYWWNGSGFTAATGAQAASIDTTHNVYAAPFINQLVIPKASGKPIIADYPAGTAATVVESAGTAPTDCRIAVPWQGTVWLTGQLASPHLLFAPRVNDLTDYDYSADEEDLFGAFISDTTFEGKLSGPICALMPQTADTMIVSTLEGFLAMRGHPRQGGIIDSVGRGRYALGQGAWCKIPGDTILTLTPLGLMSIGPEPNAVPAPLSKNKIPESLIGLPYSYDQPTVSMVYDARWHAVHIFNRGTFEQGWTFDIETGGFHRIDAPSYPFVACSFPEFDTEQSSGAMFGRYDGIHYFDKFATFADAAGVTLNPVQIAPDANKRGMIQKLRVIFGRDTPSSSVLGTLRLAVGADSQDAMSRALAGNFAYSVNLLTLQANGGLCYPRVAGQSVVMSFSHTGGQVAIEEIHMDVELAGINRMVRGPQLAIAGEQSDFSDGFDAALDAEAWVGYSTATPQVAPGENLADYTHFLDLALMPSTWWDTVQSDGRDIRVSDTSNVEVPVDLIQFSKAASTGLIAFKLSQQTTPRAVRVWCGNPDVPAPTDDASNGREATYDSNWRAFYPNGGVTDRTGYDNDLTLAGGSVSTVAGPIGGDGTNLGGSGFYQDTDFISANSLGSNDNWTLIIAAKKNAATSSSGAKILHALYDGSGATGFLAVDYNSNGTTTAARARTSGASDVTSTTDSAGVVTDWNHYTGVWNGTSHRTAYLNGTPDASPDTSTEDPTLVGTYIPLTDLYDGRIALVQIHDTVRSAHWIAYQAEMMDQAGFWGAIGAFVTVNAATPLSFDATACPLGVVVNSETGTWSGYAAATPDTPATSVINMLHLIDLANMPASWWSAVASNGVDIRATDENNVFLPLDLIDFDHDEETGFAVVRRNVFSTGAKEIRLWVGNASAITVSPCSAYGQYNVYDSDFKGFWPGGSGNDRTQWLNHTGVSPDTTGPAGNTATTYAGSSAAQATASVPATTPVTLIAAAKIASGTLFASGTIAALNSSENESAIALKTAASATPARLIMRKPGGGEVVGGNTATMTANTWTLLTGSAFGTTRRFVYVNGGGTSESTIESAPTANLDRIEIGAQKTPDGTVFNGFTGLVSLVSLHADVRPAAFSVYFSAMFNQSGFWNSWAWTASSSALPQP